MKTTKEVLLCVIFLVLFSGCNISTNSNSSNNYVTVEEKQENAEVYRFKIPDELQRHNTSFGTIEDKETGCKYFVFQQFQAGYGVSITPLLTEDGTPDCGI